MSVLKVNYQNSQFCNFSDFQNYFTGMLNITHINELLTIYTTLLHTRRNKRW